MSVIQISDVDKKNKYQPVDWENACQFTIITQ